MVNEKKRILYIEDNLSNRVLVKKLSNSSGYDYLEAEDGISGIDLAKKERPDLILMDMNLPGLDGYETTTRIKSIQDLKQIPIIALTANTQTGDKQRSLIAGCNGYITKPIDIDTFPETIATFMAGKHEKVNLEEENNYLREYSNKIVLRLEDKVREMSTLNQQLEDRVAFQTKELKETQHQLMLAEKMASISQLAAGVAHELNTPLGYINSNLSTLQKYTENFIEIIQVYQVLEPILESKPEMAAFLELIKEKMDLNYSKQDVIDLINESREGINKTRIIVQNLKDFSHVDDNEWQSIDLNKEIDRTLTMLNAELNDAGKKINIVKELNELPTIECVPPQLNQVFYNIIKNAIQAIESEGSIIISSKVDTKNAVVIQFTDSGCGISEDDIPHVFEPFFTTKPVGTGTGLGLSLSYNIIKTHGGAIKISSKQNIGTKVKLKLPINHAVKPDKSVVNSKV